MIKRLIFVLLGVFVLKASSVLGQSVGINNPTPNASSILDITSVNKGMLVPRMTTAQRVAIVTPATGLLVYDTSLNLFYYFDGTLWRPFMIGNLDWLLSGNAGTNPATQFIGTTDAQGLAFRTNNIEAMRLHSNGAIGIGTTLPSASALMDITSTSKGVLIPRMTTLQRTAIITPATGLLVYDSTLGMFYYFDGTIWRPLVNSFGWQIPGNASTNPLTDYVGTTDAQPLVFRANAAEVMRLTTTGNVGIGTTAPLASALLELNSTSRGVLVPRMTTAQRMAIVTPATGLLVYDTSLNLFYYFDGTAWRPFMVGNLDWLLAGNAGTNPATQFIGTTDAQGLAFRTNNIEAMRLHSNGAIGIGTTLPNASALVEMTSTSKGVLIPRMTTLQRTAIVTPASGLLVYDTSLGMFYYFDGAIWRPLINSVGWQIPGNAGTNPLTNYVGTADAQPLVLRTNAAEVMRLTTTGNVGIGTSIPSATALLELNSTSRGVLIPRMTTLQRTAIVTPSTGLLVYDATLGMFYYFDGTIWRPLVNSFGWQIPGNAGTNPLTDYVGTADSQPLVLRTNAAEIMRLTTTGNVGIGTTVPSATAILELNSTSRGVLIPRMTSAQRIAIVTPASGLLVYDTTGKLFYYWDGTQWVPLQGNLGWLLQGNLGTTPATNYVGTGDAQNLVIKANALEAIRVLASNQNVGIGQALPVSKFAVNGNTAIGAAYSALAAPANGAMIQGHTVVGSSAPFAVDVLSSYSTGVEVAVAGYSSGNTYAGFFQNSNIGTAGKFLKITGASGGALQAITNSYSNNANVVEIAGNGTGNSLNISDSGAAGKSINISKTNTLTVASAVEITNAGKGIGIYLKDNSISNVNPGIRIDQTRGDGQYIQMQSGNSGSGLYIYQNGTGMGQKIDMATANTNIGFQLNQAGTEKGFDINMSNALNGNDAIRIIHSGTGKGINVNVASTNSYALWATNGATIPAINPNYSVTVPSAYTTNFAPGVAIIAAGAGHGIIANSVLDVSATTDHDGGIFIVRNDNLTSTNVAATSVGARLNNVTYKVIGLGAVSTLVQDLDGDMRVMSCPETPEILFQDFGRGQLNNGVAHITLDPIYSKNIKVDAAHPLNVLIQLRGDCKGVYVTKETATGFDVVELNNGNSNAEFTWFASANRANEIIGGQESDYESMRFKKLDNPFFNQRKDK